MARQTDRHQRIFYLTGPADITSDYETWKKRSPRASSFGGGVFMEQFFQFCHDINADAYLISTATGKGERVPRLILEYRNPNTENLAGLRFHLRMLSFMIGILVAIVRFRPSLILIAVADSYWFLFYIFYFTKIKFVPFYHGTLWPRLKSINELTFVQRVLLRMTGNFLKHRCQAVLSISDVIGGQLDQITGGGGPRVLPFQPIYERELFKDISPPNWLESPFRVMFVGRVDTLKGIYLLLEVARLFRKRRYEGIVFDICGAGVGLSNVRDIVEREKLSEIKLHGHCDRERLQAFYSESHVVIVPTTREFPEGFNRVSIEAVLCGRPVIVSSSALEQRIISAAIEVQSGDVQGFADAIVELREDRSLYEQRCAACVALQDRFYDKKEGWEEGLKSILEIQVEPAGL